MDPNCSAGDSEQSSEISPVKSEEIDCTDYSPDDMDSQYSTGFEVTDSQNEISPRRPCSTADMTLSSVNSPSSSSSDNDNGPTEENLFSFDKMPSSDQPLIALEPNFNTEDYLFTLDRTEGITDLFDVENIM